MRQLSSLTKPFLLFLFTFSISNIAAESMTVKYPNYLKMYADGLFAYQIEFDEINRISGIRSDNENKNNISVVYENDGSITLSFPEKNKKIDSDDILITKSGNNGLKLTTKGNNYVHFKNSIAYVYSNRNNEIVYKYEYLRKSAGWIVRYITEDYYDEATNLYEYSLWDDLIEISGGRQELITEENLLILYNYNPELAFLLFPFLSDDFVSDYHFNSYRSSTFLTEGNVSYEASNLQSVSGLPWASSNGYGIGDKIWINLNTKNEIGFGLYNGFQSTQKAYLYEENSRVKKIKITCLQTKREKTVDVKDTSESQFISISDLILYFGDVFDFEIEVLEVYPGTKYSDLCIQAIIPASEESLSFF